MYTGGVHTVKKVSVRKPHWMCRHGNANQTLCLRLANTLIMCNTTSSISTFTIAIVSSSMTATSKITTIATTASVASTTASRVSKIATTRCSSSQLPT